MNIRLNPTYAEGYKSRSQRARRITEGWFGERMFCPACTSRHLEPLKDNTKVVDFICPACGAEFQLKAKGSRLGRKVRDAAYDPLMQRVLAGKSPHFAFMHYDPSSWQVRNLLLVPSHFIVPSIIEKCRPLSTQARRSGWVGCNIVIGELPGPARVSVVREGSPESPQALRELWARFLWMAQRDVKSRGWTADVLRCVEQIGLRKFRLADVYAFEDHLSQLHPNNNNVRDKIRQQLQVLRDRGVLRFLGRGRYEML